jgi:DNA mismatch endonuclease (patch repair protein)
MPDVFTKAKRSQVMSLIRSRGNKETELALAILLRANKISGWRRHVQVRSAEFGVRNAAKNPKSTMRTGRSGRNPQFKVRPDFVFPKARLALFVDGCFWHGCPRHGNQPANNRAFWTKKLAGNRRRDRLVNRALRRAGWTVIRIWQCALEKRPEACVRRIKKVTGGR